MGERVQKSLKNAKVGLLFYFLSILMAFFSRRIFLENLSVDFIGLTQTLLSILSLLNISEMGFGTLIGYFLYKPIQMGDHKKITEVVSLFGWLTRWVGTFIGTASFIISLFFPWMFANTTLPLSIVYFSFYAFVGANIIGYFINYRQILLDSDQKTYMVSMYSQGGDLVKSLIQIFLAYYYKNLYLWVAIEFGYSLMTCLILNHVIRREYPWLHTDRSRGREILRQYPEIWVKAKQIVVHRLKNSLLSKSDEIMIFAFVSLKMVAYYGNYTMIVGKLTALFANALAGLNASVGNLVAEGHQANTMKVFWELLGGRYMVTGVIVIFMAALLDPVIGIWVGPEYILSTEIVALLLFNMYIMFTRPSVDLFVNAYGLYADTWAAWAEGGINLAVTIVCAWQWGLIGILLGKTVSMLLLVVLWKPYYLFRDGFHLPVRLYWTGVLRHIGLFLLCLAGMLAVKHVLAFHIAPDVLSVAKGALLLCLPTTAVYLLLLWLLTPGVRDLAHRLPFLRER